MADLERSRRLSGGRQLPPWAFLLNCFALKIPVYLRQIIMDEEMSLYEMYPHMFRQSARLFALPSLVGGMSAVLDVGGTLREYNQNLSPEEADFASMQSDWHAVGGDLKYAIASCMSEPSRRP